MKQSIALYIETRLEYFAFGERSIQTWFVLLASFIFLYPFTLLK